MHRTRVKTKLNLGFDRLHRFHNLLVYQRPLWLLLCSECHYLSELNRTLRRTSWHKLAEQETAPGNGEKGYWNNDET